VPYTTSTPSEGPALHVVVLRIWRLVDRQFLVLARPEGASLVPNLRSRTLLSEASGVVGQLLLLDAPKGRQSYRQ
jgi:hypothetical protein